jgi:hypothetical protein
LKAGDLVKHTATNDRLTGVIVKLGEMIRGRYSYPWAKVVWTTPGWRSDEVLVKDLEVISESR